MKLGPGQNLPPEDRERIKAIVRELWPVWGLAKTRQAVIDATGWELGKSAFTDMARAMGVQMTREANLKLMQIAVQNAGKHQRPVSTKPAINEHIIADALAIGVKTWRKDAQKQALKYELRKVPGVGYPRHYLRDGLPKAVLAAVDRKGGNAYLAEAAESHIARNETIPDPFPRPYNARGEWRPWNTARVGA